MNKDARADFLAAALLSLQVFWDATLCRWVSDPHFSKDRVAFILKSKQLKKNAISTGNSYYENLRHPKIIRR